MKENDSGIRIDRWIMKTGLHPGIYFKKYLTQSNNKI